MPSKFKNWSGMGVLMNADCQRKEQNQLGLFVHGVGGRRSEVSRVEKEILLGSREERIQDVDFAYLIKTSKICSHREKRWSGIRTEWAWVLQVPRSSKATPPFWCAWATPYSIIAIWLVDQEPSF